MGTPQPKFPLDNHCSVVHNNTLYVYSPAGFQSLGLEQGAQWEVLPMDISLTGAQCVRGVPNGDQSAAKLYVVGGSPNATAASWDYPGLMEYSFANKKWDWIRPQSWNTQNRQNHAAVYLSDSQKILVYAGSQAANDFGPSTQGFLFSTVSPYTVESLQSQGAPPSVKPMLMSSDSKTAVLVGGGASNTAIWKFTEADGWRNLGVTLAQPISNQATEQCAVITGDDGSVVMNKFNLGVIPNTVQQITLLGKNGTPASPGSTKTKRLTASNMPTYNATYAPMSLRSGYSLAQGDTNGMTVASGGDPAAPIAIFDATHNSWVNATELFGGQQVIQASASSSSASASASPTFVTSTLAPSSTNNASAMAAAVPDNKGKMLTVLGATLGTIFGMALFLILILVCLRYRKNKNRTNSAYLEKDRMSFADRGAEFMKEAGGAVVTYHPNFNNDSATSLAIIQGRGNGHKRNTASDASTAGLVKKTSPLGYSDPVELSKFDMKPEQVNEKIVRQNSGRAPPLKTTLGARSSGWSRYFANNEATNLASVQADRSTYASDRTSGLSQHRASRGYAPQIAPLDIPKFDGQRLSRVASGSPTLGTPVGILPHQVQPMQAELGRANSNGSMRSDVSREDHYFRKPVESWTPVGDDHRTSSNYTGSMVIDPHSKYEVASSYYPDGTDSFYSKSKLGSFYPGQNSAPGLPDTRDSTATMFPSSNGSIAPTANKGNTTFSSMYPSPPRLGEPQDRESTVTIFPGGSGPVQTKNVSSPKLGSFYPPPRVGHESTVTMFPGPGPTQEESKKGQSDMSWLNLGTSR